jgi:maleylacetate reductase
MQPFLYTSHAYRVHFGFGTIAELPAEVARLNLRRVLVLATPEQEASARDVARRLAPAAVGVFAGATMHTPVEVTQLAMERVKADGVDGLVAVGGGSTTGLGKAIALRTDLPQIVVPTTYAGSEMTPIIGETKDGLKVTQRSPKVLPEVVIYDVDLTMSLPVRLAGTSGINAIAHAVEAAYAQDRNPVIGLMAVEGVRALYEALPRIAVSPQDRDARAQALYGAWLCGICLGSVGMALHHKLCHTLGGAFDLPHAETHTILLPHAVAYNATHAGEAIDRFARALNVADFAQSLFDLAGRMGAKRALKDIGMPEDGIARAAELAMANPYWNPRPLEASAVRTLIERAYAGVAPSSA